MNNDQFLMNAKLAESHLTNSDHALGELADIMVRAKEIAIGQSSGASSTDDTRLGVAEEVAQLFNQAVSIANRRVGDRYLFGGFKTDTPPVDESGRYRGDRGSLMVEIAKDVFLTSNVTGLEAFNTKPESSTDVQLQKSNAPYGNKAGDRVPANTTADVELQGPDAVPPTQSENVNAFDELQSLRIGLLTGDLEGIRSTLERFDQLHARLISNRAKVGSRMTGLQTTVTAIERQNLTNAQLTSSLEDADMAQVVGDMAKEEQVFRSALSSSQKLMQPTLMDFIK